MRVSATAALTTGLSWMNKTHTLIHTRAHAHTTHAQREELINLQHSEKTQTPRQPLDVFEVFEVFEAFEAFEVFEVFEVVEVFGP